MFSHSRFLLFGIVCALMFFFGASVSIELQAQRKQATEFAQEVAMSLSVMLKNDLEEWIPLNTLLDTIDDKRRYTYLDELVRHNLLNVKLEKIKFFNKHGIIIYAEKPELLGQDHTGKKQLQQAFQGEPASNIIDTKEYENAYGDVQTSSLIETYLPVYDNHGSVTHVMEVYQNFDASKEKIKATLLRTGAMSAGIALASFSLIFVLLKKLNELSRERDLLVSCLPICSFCKKIRDDTTSAADNDEKPRWVQLERYLTDKENLEFTHSLCEECMQQHYGEFLNKKPPTA
ncbi:MAG: hypothetical protein IH613_05010 [Desulfuromonadales bacterium]|nr:hypothetical protein [Desulfuromonadales bacterium]